MTLRMLTVFAVFFALILQPKGCRKKNNTADSAKTDPPVAVKTDSLPWAKVDATLDAAALPLNFRMDSMTVRADTLSVFVNYSGGCKEHFFELLSNGMYAKSMPPQLSIFLKHDNQGDACRALVMKELKFNIKPFRYPGQQHGTVFLKMQEFSVKYEY